jgi:hypothetical protein
MRRINRRAPDFLHFEVFQIFLNSYEYRDSYEQILGR